MLLAPDIQEAILEGRQPKAMQLKELTLVMPMAWEEQRQNLIVESPQPAHGRSITNPNCPRS